MAVAERTTETAAPTADAVWKQMQERGVEFVFAQFVDMYARPSAKLVPVRSRDDFDGILSDGAGFAGFAAGEIGQLPSDPDIAAIPDLASYTPVPWQQNLARFACDVTVEGEEWPYDPRTILRRMLANLRQVYLLRNETERFRNRGTILQSRNRSHATPSAANNSA